MARLDVRLLGGFDVVVGGRVVTEFESLATEALLARLAAEPGRRIRRAELAELLWPDRAAGRALANLRHTLAVARRAIGDRERDRPVLVADRDGVGVDPGAEVRVDVVELRELARTPPTAPGAVAAWEAALALRRGPFLEGFDADPSAEWGAWLLATRAELDGVVADLYARLADLRERTGEHLLAQALVGDWLGVDPWNEEAHRRLIRLLAADGRRTEAIEHAERYVADLRDRLGAAPGAELVALVDEVRVGRPVARTVEVPGLPPRSPAPASVDPVVARDEELAWLHRRLDDALSGSGGVAFVAGAAGVGKTVLLRRFVDEARARMPDLRLLAGVGNAHAGPGDPFLPFRQVLGLVCGDLERAWAQGTLAPADATRLWTELPVTVETVLDDGPYLLGTLIDAAALLRRFEGAFPEHPLLERLVTAVAAAERRALDPTRQRQPILDQAARVLVRLAAQRPILLVLDDLHWADVGTIELLRHLVGQLTGTPLFVVAAFRPPDAPARGEVADPIQLMVDEVRAHHCSECRLELAGTRRFVDAWLDTQPNLLDEEFRVRLYRTTHGHALFTVETIAAMQLRGDLVVDEHGRWVASDEIAWDELPPRVEATIAARTSQLPVELRRDLDVAAVQGDTFALDVVAAVRGVAPAELVRRVSAVAVAPQALLESVGAERVGEGNVERYRFRHALIRQYLYDQLAAAERRVLHAATGRALADLRGEGGDDVAVALALHFDEAGLVDQAIEHRLRAGRLAIRLSATTEAIEHLERALVLVHDLEPTADRDRLELTVLVPLGSCLQARAGYDAPETLEVYERLRALIPVVGPGLETAEALGALIAVDGMRARFGDALAGCERLLAIATELDAGALMALAHTLSGWVHFMLNRLVESLEHLDRALELYDEERDGWLTHAAGLHVASTARSWRACVAWSLGRPDEARRDAAAAIASSRRVDYPFGLAFAVGVAGAVVSFLLLDGAGAVAHADEEFAIAEREDFAFYRAAAHVHRGAGRVLLGDADGGLAEQTAGLATWEQLGTDAFVAWIMSTQVEPLVTAGRLGDAAATVREIERRLATGDEQHAALWLPIALAAVRRAEGDDEAAETALRSGLDLQERCAARGPQLRTASALAELLIDQGRHTEVEAVLAPVLATFTEGADTADVRRAHRALDAVIRA